MASIPTTEGMSREEIVKNLSWKPAHELEVGDCVPHPDNLSVVTIVNSIEFKTMFGNPTYQVRFQYANTEGRSETSAFFPLYFNQYFGSEYPVEYFDPKNFLFQLEMFPHQPEMV